MEWGFFYVLNTGIELSNQIVLLPVSWRMGAYVDASFKFYSFIGVRLFYELNTGIELSDQIVLLSVSWRMGAYVDASFKFYSFIGVRLFLCAEYWYWIE